MDSGFLVLNCRFFVSVTWNRISIVDGITDFLKLYSAFQNQGFLAWHYAPQLRKGAQKKSGREASRVVVWLRGKGGGACRYAFDAAVP